MTIALRAAGTATSATAAVTAVNPATPAGCQAGDLAVMTVTMKPYNTTITTPAGWEKIGEQTNGTTASGTDTGSTKIAMFVQRNPISSTSVGNLSFTNANSCAAVIHVYSKSSSNAWDYTSFTDGGDSTNGANYSATGAAGISVASGDWVLASTAVNSDLGTISAQAIAGMSGATIGTVQNRTNQDITTGNDTAILASDAPISAGSSSNAPTFSYTNASSTSGTTLFLRLRETTKSAISTFTDDFTDLSNWTATRTTVVSGEAKIAAVGGYSDGKASLIRTAQRYDLTGSSFVFKLPANLVTPNTDEWFACRLQDGPDIPTVVSGRNWVGWWLPSAGSQAVEIQRRVAGTNTNPTSATYNSSTHVWFKISESGGSVSWWTSADGSSWTQFGSSWTSTIDLRDLEIYFEVSGSSAKFATIDKINITSTAHEIAATSTITATPTTASEVPRTGDATSTITASVAPVTDAQRQVTATSTITATTTTAGDVAKPLDATSTITSSQSADAFSAKESSASSTITSLQSAAADGNKPLDASSTITSSQSSESSVPRSASASSTITATASADGYVAKPLDATSTITASQSVDSSVPRSASATSTITATTTASAAGSKPLDATSTITATVTPVTDAQRQAAASSTITATTSSASSVPRTGDSSSTVTATQSAAATADHPIAASSTTTATATPQSSVPRSAAASSTITATTTADATTDIPIGGTSTITASTTTAATADHPIAAASTITATPTVTASVAHSIAASSTITATTTADSSVGEGGTAHDISADSTITVSQTASVDATSAVSAASQVLADAEAIVAAEFLAMAGSTVAAAAEATLLRTPAPVAHGYAATVQSGPGSGSVDAWTRPPEVTTGTGRRGVIVTSGTGTPHSVSVG